MSYYGFSPYVSVAKRREKALREMNKLRKKGKIINPIEIEKRKITKTFWGNAWSDHIESFSDYENRLPRGRRYVSNGSVCHLAMSKGLVEAIVSGSELYNIRIEISILPNTLWDNIKVKCAGKIDSLLDLLGGKISDGVMDVVCNHDEGLFPKSKEIKLSCDCPDWATMCKHVAAVLYGVGARLDHSPENLFELRGVDHNELIDKTSVLIDTTRDTGSGRRRIDPSVLGDVFDIDLLDTTSVDPLSSSSNEKSKIKKVKSKKLKKAKPTNSKKTTQSKPRKSLTQIPKYFSGASIRKKRKSLDLTQSAFAKQVGVTAATISNWEKKGRYKVNLHQDFIEALKELW